MIRPRSAATVAALGAALLVVGCSSSSSPSSANGSASPGIESSVSAPRQGRSAARFELQSGAGQVTVRAAAIGDDLYRIGVPGGASLTPQVSTDGDAVRLRLQQNGVPGPSSVEIDVNPAVAWTLALNGGTAGEIIDMTAGRLAALTVSAGAGRLELDLGAPHGSVPIRISGGTSQLHVISPRGVPVRLGLSGGVGRVDIDGRSSGSLSAPLSLADPGFTDAGDRYDVSVTAGVGALTLSRR